MPSATIINSATQPPLHQVTYILRLGVRIKRPQEQTYLTPYSTVLKHVTSEGQENLFVI